MRWPWVSRLAYEVVSEQLARANERADKLQQALVGMQRWSAGLPEKPRQERPPVEPMPADLAEYYNKRFANSKIARHRRNAAYVMHSQGQSWEAIREKVLPKDEDED